MRLIPVPITDRDLQDSAVHWLPFLPAISRRSKETIPSLFGQIIRHEVWLTLIWDDATNKPAALIGTRFHIRKSSREGGDKIAELVWATGRNYKAWIHLIPTLENLLRQEGAMECRPICRPGWARILKKYGYRTTHIQMEKSL